MTDRIAVFLALFIVSFFLLDHFVLHLEMGTIVLRGIVDAVRWLAFWR